MYGEVILEPQAAAELALFVPRNAVVGSVKDPKVYVLGQDETVSLRTVQVGEEDGDMILILNGLQEGETVVTTGQINLSDGKKVSVISATANTQEASK